MFDSSLQSPNPVLGEVLSYIRQRSGKMMRPLLVLLMAKLCGHINATTLHAALSLELLHTASLIHDDVVDESNKRSGQLSVNAVYNNKLSVLVGDYLLATSLRHSALTGEIRLVELISRLGQTLSEGEIIQLSNTNASDFADTVYFDVIRKKTAALFATCAEAGARSVHASEEAVKNSASIGELIGMAFQIKDDIFDYFLSEEIGKPTGNDMREGKLTLPALHVLNKCPDGEMHALAHRIRALSATPEEIDSFMEHVIAHGGMEYAGSIMMAYRDKALALLPAAVDPAARRALSMYIHYAVDRDR